MKTIVLNRLTILVCFGLLLQSTAAVIGAGLTVEQVQRDFQVRYRAVTGSYLVWPECKTSTQTPAPQYPKDGYYGDLSTDPDKAVEVVQDLVQKFYVDNQIFDKFLTITALSQLEGASSLPVFPAQQPPSSVTADNYPFVLQQIESVLSQMKFCKAPTYQIISYQTQRLTAAFDTDSSDAESCVENHHRPTDIVDLYDPLDPTPWGGTLAYVMCSEPPFNFGNYPQILKFESVSGSGINLASEYCAMLYNNRGYVEADLREFSRGKNAELFLMYAAPEADYNTAALAGMENVTTGTYRAPATQPTSAAVNTYGSWPGVTPQLGQVWDSAPIPGADEIQTQFGIYANDSLDIGGWEVTDAVVVVDMEDFTPTQDPQDCCNCGGQCKPSGQNNTVQSLHVNIGLGSDNYGGSAGALSINAEVPSPSLSTEDYLRYSLADTVQVNYGFNPGQMQFLTSQALVDVEPNESGDGYTISFYDSAHEGTPDDTGWYEPDSSQADTTIVVDNPDTSGLTYNQLRVTRTDSGNTTVTLYTYTADNSTTPPTSTWTMTTGGGARNESRASQWSNGNTIRTETHSITDNQNNVIYKEQNTYQLFGWAQEELVQQVMDPDNAKLTSTWDYYTDPVNDSGGYGHPKDYTDANGHWTTYQYDSAGRETKRVEQFQNSAFNSADSLNRVTSTTYSTTDPEITTVVTLQGQEISREYEVVHSDEVDDIVCQTVGAAWDASDNLVTVMTRYTTGTFADEPSSVTHPDGTMEFYTYVIDGTSGTRTDTVDSGQPNGSMTVIADGTETVTVKGNVGQMISRTVSDIVTGVTLTNDVYSDYDNFNRPQRVTHLDQTHEDTSYACCGIDITTDRDGVTTEYLYDVLNRQYGSVRNGIMRENIMDPQGQVVVQRRTGTDNSVIVTHMTAYDVAGRMSSETNALNGKTSYADTFNSMGQRVHTIVYPNTGTRIEVYNEDGSLASVTGTAAFPVRYEYGVEQDGGVWRSYAKEIKLNLGGTDSSEWTKAYFDMVDRSYKTVFAAASTPYPYSQSFYNNQGQLWKQVDPDNVVTLFQYNPKGEQEYTAVDVNQNDTIDFSGSDRITRTVHSVVPSVGGKPDLVEMDNYVWKDGSAAGTLVSRSQTSTDGLNTWTTAFRDSSTPVTGLSQTVYGAISTVTQTAPDNSYSVSVYTSGQLTSVTRYDSANVQIGKTTYTYDAHGREQTSIDARNGATTYVYNKADLVATNITPAPGNGGSAQATITWYDTMLHPYSVVNPDQTTVTRDYYLTGLLKDTHGSRTYPVEYTYDYAGRLQTMESWQNFTANSGTSITTWNYDPYRGWLANKRYNDNTGPDYTYTPGGRLNTRTWARTGTGSQRIVTTYTYGFDDGVSGDDYADLVGVVYANDPQSTPSATYSYDRLGRQKTLARNGMTETLAYNDANQLLSDSFSGGTLDGLTVTRGYDALSRRQTLSVNTTPSLTTTYGYDNASRLQTVSDGNANSATYTYTPNSPLVEQIAFKQGSTARMTTTKSYDYLNRLTQIQNSTGASPFASSGYTYNSANQRMQKTEADGTQWNYSYDSLGQLKSANKMWPDSTFVPGQQFEYTFDDIGNRTSTSAGGDNSGANLRTANYTPNLLNQYNSHDSPGYWNIVGIAVAGESVTVNGQSTYRRGQYFQAEISVANSSAPVWQSAVVTAPGETTISGNRFFAQTPEQPTYDLDGNLTQDGRWVYTWDAENRLVKVESLSSDPTPSKRRVTWEYDCRGRRIRQSTYDGSSGSYVLTQDLKFLNDKWNLIAELAAANNAVVRGYTWGNDLSGSANGAGGVGGLLEMSYCGQATTNAFIAFDGNGNAEALVNAADANTIAQYEYGPFGELLRTTGPAAKLNPMRYSTKYQDDETGLIYYGYRYYDATMGRWENRDPIGERGGINLYGYIYNSPANYRDDWGQSITPILTIQNPSDQQDAVNWMGNTVFWGVDLVNQGINSMMNSPNPFTRGIGSGLFAASFLWGGGEIEEAGAVQKACKMWRAVNPQELANINNTGVFRNLGSAEGKYFSLTQEGASSYAKQAVKAFGDEPYTIVETEIPQDQVPGVTIVDGNVPAVVIPNNLLPILQPKILPYSIVPLP